MVRFGVNYVPRKDWFFSWNRPDLAAAEEDFAVISSLGFDHIRLHLRWDIFQRSFRCADGESIAVLRELLDLAHKYKLQVQVTVFNGWMSGLWFLPAFVGGRNVITDEEMRRAEIFLLREIADKIAVHPAFMGFDLGNEINVYDSLVSPFSVADGDEWLKIMTDECEKLAPGKFHVLGVDHYPWFAEKSFSRAALASCGTATSLHAWVGFCGALQKFGGLAEETLSLAEYNIELANAYAADGSRPVWIQEFGAPTVWYNEADAEKYAENTVLNAMRSDNLWGFTWWCSHDIDRSLDMFNPLEYDLGLIGTDNKVKPIGKALKRIISEVKAGKRAKELATGEYIVVDNGKTADLGLLAEYGDMIRKGVHAKFKLSLA